MSASHEFIKPSAQGDESSLPLVFGDNHDYRTPTGSEISYLKEPTTCPPAPRKPRPPPQPSCKKRLFQPQPQAQGDQHQPSESFVPLISLRFDEMEHLYHPHPPAVNIDKRRRSVSASTGKHCTG